MNKDEFLKNVLDFNFNEDYLKKISQKEKKEIQLYVESIMSTFYEEIFKPISNAIDADPEALKKACKEIENELLISGSNGK